MKPIDRIKDVWRALKHASPTILTCAAVAGVIGTTALAVKGTVKAQKLVREAAENKGEELTGPEKVKAAAPAYIPMAAAAVSTISCIIGANVLNKRQQKALLGTYALLGQTYRRYREAVNRVYGEDADKKIQAEMAKDVYISADGVIYDPIQDKSSEKLLFFDSNSQRYFEATIPAVLNAIYHLNRNLAIRGNVSLNEFYDFLGIDKIPGGDEIGWGWDELMENGLMWLDFENVYTKMEDGMECCIISSCMSATPICEELPF